MHDLTLSRDAEEIEHGLATRSFKHFVKLAWAPNTETGELRGCADPAPLQWNWHMDAICDHLQAVTDGRLKRLIINIPPGHAKSMLVSVLWPAWQWIREPQKRILCASYAPEIAMRDAVKARELMRGDWYTQWFRGPERPFENCREWGFKKDQDNKTEYDNTAGGFRISLSVGGKGTGFRGDGLIIDDPHKAKDAHSMAALAEAVRWKNETMASRFNDPKTAWQVLVMQRLHENDLSGYLLRQGGWQHLCLPSEYEPDRKSTTYTQTRSPRKIWSDPRTRLNEPLFPEKFPREILDQKKKDMGAFAYAGQEQQRPVPAQGGVLQRAWFRRRWVLPGDEMPEDLECRVIPTEFDRYSIFVDAAFKGGPDNDKVAIGVFGTKGADQYLLDLDWRQMGFVDTVAALQDMRARWSRVTGIYVEDKANGSAIMDQLDGKVPGLIAIDPADYGGGKHARIAACSPFIEAGNLWLPNHAEWLPAFIAEAASFPRAPNDDAIDMVAYALLHLCGKSNNVLAAMSKL